MMNCTDSSSLIDDLELTATVQNKRTSHIDKSREWFKNNLKLNRFPILEYTNKIDWNGAFVMEKNGITAVEIPLILNNGLELTPEGTTKNKSINRLLILHKNGKTKSFHININTENYSDNNLKNYSLINYFEVSDDFQGKIIVMNSRGKIVKLNSFRNLYDPVDEKNLRKEESVKCMGLYEVFSDGSTELVAILYCYPGGTGYNEYTDDTDGNYGHGGGGGSSETEDSELIVVIEPDVPITDILEFLKCLDKNSEAIITVYTNQPIPNSTSAHYYNFVGHTFISITQGSNTNVIGYYPQSNWVNPVNPASESALGDNGHEEYNVSILTTVNASTLNSIIDTIANSNPNYDLNSYNCTDFAIEIGNLAGMNLPEANGTWPSGGGSNPGTLGEYIRNMSGPNITVFTNDNRSNAELTVISCN